MKTQFDSEMPLVVQARMVAYALLGTQKAIEQAGNLQQAQVHKFFQLDYQKLLESFSESDD